MYDVKPSRITVNERNFSLEQMAPSIETNAFIDVIFRNPKRRFDFYTCTDNFINRNKKKKTPKISKFQIAINNS